MYPIPVQKPRNHLMVHQWAHNDRIAHFFLAKYEQMDILQLLWDRAHQRIPFGKYKAACSLCLSIQKG